MPPPKPSTTGQIKKSNDTRQRQRVMGLEAFAHQGGAGKALTQFRQRKQRKRQQTAVALRQYQKAMTAAGYKAGQGASRKRRLEGSDGDEESKEEDETADNNLERQNKHQSGDTIHKPKEADATDDTTEPPRRKRHRKTNPYKDLEQQHAQRQKTKTTTSKTADEREKERQEKLRARRQRTHRLRQRTTRGQPVMKNLVHDILDKLQKEEQQR